MTVTVKAGEKAHTMITLITMAMATALVARGWRYGVNLLHLCFPHAEHDETAWGMRLHLPMQFLNGAVARASRAVAPVLGDTPDHSSAPEKS